MQPPSSEDGGTRRRKLGKTLSNHGVRMETGRTKVQDNLLGMLTISILCLAFTLLIVYYIYRFVHDTEDENSDGVVDIHDVGIKVRRVCCCNLDNESLWALLRVLVISGSTFWVFWGVGWVQPVVQQLLLLVWLALVVIGIVSLVASEALGRFMFFQNYIVGMAQRWDEEKEHVQAAIKSVLGGGIGGAKTDSSGKPRKQRGGCC